MGYGKSVWIRVKRYGDGRIKENTANGHGSGWAADGTLSGGGRKADCPERSGEHDRDRLLPEADNGYFKTLVSEGVIESGTAEVDIESQRTYLESLGKEVTVNGSTKKPDELSDDEVKVANTGSHVFLKATVVLADAIEDVSLTINV